MPEMTLTGERTLPGIAHENYWFRRHEVVYRWASDLLCSEPHPALRILDAGSGEGYGADLLRRRTAAHVTALDYDEQAATHLRRRYADIDVVRGNLVQLPFGDNAFDAVVSLQTVEHLWDQNAFVADCLRVTRPGGLILLSTPNHLTFPAGNICHHRELTAPELTALLSTPHAAEPLVVGLDHGVRIREWEHRGGDLVTAQLASAPQDWDHALSDFVASVTVDDFVLGGTDLEATLDLLAVLRVRAR
ncbi:MAG TPA: class I SAM-dependent methyltransferase [Actinopolymorphaceae bacterium]|nr:class I SAM-dependent methyltransferase [Actinopolymorphaceae bacterium]